MAELQLALLFIFVLLLLLGTGVWIGLALLGAAFFGMELFTGRASGDAMVTSIWRISSSWSLTALPLFIWMGEILYRTRLADDMFKGISPWVARLPGGLLHFNVAGCALFAAVSGSSVATLATVGRMSIPELRQRDYPERMVIGTLAGAGTLGLLIPPSLILIVYGVTVNASISELFIAGVIPGLVLAALFMGYIAAWSILRRHRLPPPEPRVALGERLRRTRSLFPILLLILLVIGSMYVGLATATEAAALGVLGALALAAAQGSLTAKNLAETLTDAVSTSAMIALILAGSAFLSMTMGFTGLPRSVAGLIGSLELSRFELLMSLLVFYIVVGCFLEGISAVILTMAVVEPIIRSAGIDIVWFGVFIVLVVEMAQITPPVGLNLFVLQGMTGHEISYIAAAAFPMFLIMIAMVFILIAFPGLATWLPEYMRPVS